MSENLPDLIARIRVDTRDLEEAPRRAALLGGAIGGALGSVLAGPLQNALGRITGFVGEAVPAFARLEDATDAAAVVFGDSMGVIIEQAKGARDTLGATEAQVIDAANSFGTFGQAAGLTGPDLAAFSTDLTQVGADLASFKGGSPEEAFNAIGAALRGEAEPIRKYGILLDDATLKAKALALGIADGTSALTPQQKVLAAQAVVMEQAAIASGNFVDTMNSTANVAKRQEVAVTSLQTAIGGALAPAITTAKLASLGFIDSMTGIVERVTPAIQGFFDLVNEAISAFSFDSFTAQFEGAGGLFDTLGQAVQPFVEAFRALGPVLAEVIPTIVQVATSLSPVGLVIDALLPVLPELAAAFSTALGGLLAAVTPILPVIAELAGVIAGVLGQAVAAVLPIVLELVGIFGDVFASVLLAVSPLLAAVGEVLAALLPVVAALIPPILAVVQALLPIVSVVAELIGALLPPLIDLFVAIIVPVAELVGVLVSALAPILTLVAGIISGVLAPVLGFLAEVLTVVIGWVINLAGPVLGAIVAALGVFIRGISNVIGWLSSFFGALGQAAGAVGRMAASVGEGIGRVIQWFRDLPGRVVSSLGNLGLLLLQSGRNIIQGLITGIGSMVSKVTGAIGGVVQKIRDFLPFSPAKEGPLSGSGSPELAGQKIGQMLADGMGGSRSKVLSAAGALAAAASVNATARVGVSTLTSGLGGGRSTGAPLVKVYLGDQELTHLVKGVVTDWASGEARSLTLGGAY